MNEKQWKQRGVITGCIAPVVWLLLLIGQWAGLWSTPPDSSLLSTYIVVLMVLMVVGAAAPLWWLLMLYRRRSALQARPTLLIGLNLLALAVGILCFF